MNPLKPFLKFQKPFNSGSIKAFESCAGSFNLIKDIKIKQLTSLFLKNPLSLSLISLLFALTPICISHAEDTSSLLDIATDPKGKKSLNDLSVRDKEDILLTMDRFYNICYKDPNVCNNFSSKKITNPENQSQDSLPGIFQFSKDLSIEIWGKPSTTFEPEISTDHHHSSTFQEGVKNLTLFYHICEGNLDCSYTDSIIQ